MSFHVDTTEVKHLQVDLAQVGGRVGAKVAAAVRESARDVERDAKRFVPVLTGALRDSIKTTITGSGRSASTSAEVGTSLYYAGFTEYGTSRQSPFPFMRPAFDKNAPLLENKIADATDGML